MGFPTDWPEGCPPEGTQDAGGNVYRVVRGNPCCAEDFASHFELGKMPHAPACLRCGLSVFRDGSDAVHMSRKYPKMGSLLARGALTADHGKAMLTTGQRPTHTTWWPYLGVVREAMFTVVEGG